MKFECSAACLLLIFGIATTAHADDPPQRRDIVGTEKKLYSHMDEELVIRDFFQDARGGFFLDVGAARPITNSTTYYLEKHLGWKGIAIDALPHYAEQYAEKRPGTRFENYIVTDHAGTTEEFYWVRAAPELSSTTKNRDFMGKKLHGKEIKVPTTTLNDLLEKAKVEKVDFMSMDIEGGAPKALAGFDIKKYRPDLVCIEMDADKDYHELLGKYFEDNGYVRVDRYLENDWVNWYFTPKPNDVQEKGKDEAGDEPS